MKKTPNIFKLRYSSLADSLMAQAANNAKNPNYLAKVLNQPKYRAHATIVMMYSNGLASCTYLDANGDKLIEAVASSNPVIIGEAIYTTYDEQMRG